MGQGRDIAIIGWTAGAVLFLGSAIALDDAVDRPETGTALTVAETVQVATPTTTVPRPTTTRAATSAPATRSSQARARAAAPTVPLLQQLFPPPPPPRRTTPPTSAPAPRPAPKPVRTDPPSNGKPGPVADKRPARTAAPADRYAFLVGIRNYRAPTHDTLGGAADVRLIRQSLLNAGWLSKNIKVVVDEQATGAAVRNGIAWLAARSVPGKTFSFFHYSGHVKQFGGGTEALWPVDRDWIKDSQLAARLANVKGRMWVDIAGCEAASFMPGVASSRVLFSGSSKASEKSYEHPGWGTSVWTGLLFRTSPANADANHNGEVVIGEALRYSAYFAKVVTSGQRAHGPQHPQVAGDSVRGWTLSRPPA